MDVEKTIEFLLDEQAKMFAGMEELRVRMDESHERQKQINVSLAQAVLSLTGSMEKLAIAQAESEKSLAALAAEQTAAHTKIDTRLEALAALNAEGAGRMNALIAVVDGLVRRTQQ
ncbi:MAG: hypothetical protein EXQ52_01970 [Bryobacterales bacterium]|nr:hypothetical protein [Bryobacterales bacterium]